MKTLIVIPARMMATRFPNKPMALIKGKPMIEHVWDKAVKSKIGRVIVACCEKEVAECISSIGGEVILTNPDIPSGTDRVFSAIENDPDFLSFDSIINLQGDMPLINTNSIQKVNDAIKQGYDISTLVTNFSSINEMYNNNVTKAHVKWIKKEIIGEAVSFNKNIKIIGEKDIYHHVGIYGFTPQALTKFVKLNQSEHEKKYKLEQMRALDNDMTIGISYIKDVPISVDTYEDLINIEKLIKG
tara:strand:+ start:1359 stop:2087 length:729 start_codon:yes stop_codon:yes gene_type:complete